jgi:TolB-like protein/DNA-binding winged helix-turn-helix (wHTH) protein/Flp pilus assembly protein TadD
MFVWSHSWCTIHFLSPQLFIMSTQPVRAPDAIQFGDYELDLRLRELRCAGRPLKLERIPVEVLSLLVENEGQVVCREQIVERIWGKGVFLDTDNSINGAVRKLRQALQDNPEQPRFVQTVTGKGYRFIAPVSEATAKPQLAAALDSIAAPPEKVRPALRRWMAGIAIATVVLASLFGGWRFEHRDPPSQAVGRKMLAVLPFDNLTGDSGQDYLSEGFTEEMITQLGRLDPVHLGVIARTSAEHYKQSHLPVAQIARELGVEYVLEGSVRRNAQRVRITAQLIRSSDQTHLWAQEYDRDMTDLLPVQGEIAQEVASEIQLTLDPSDIQSALAAKQAPATTEAYELYLKGRYFWNKRTVEGLQEAIHIFQEVIARDPNYAPAYAGLADSYALLCGYSVAPPGDFMLQARAAAVNALRLDERLPQAHTSMALIAESYDFDWRAAETEFRRAIALDPNYATAHEWYAEHLAWRGRFDEALVEIGRARRLDPMSLIVAADEAKILYYSRQYDRAIAQYQTILEMQPDFPAAHMVAFAYFQKGMVSSALRDVNSWNCPEDQLWNLMIRTFIYEHSGRRAEARQSLQELLKINRRRPVDPAPIILAFIASGRNNEAVAWLEKGYRQHSMALRELKVDPFYDPLRADPRFQDLLRRVALNN